MNGETVNRKRSARARAGGECGGRVRNRLESQYLAWAWFEQDMLVLCL